MFLTNYECFIFIQEALDFNSITKQSHSGKRKQNTQANYVSRILTEHQHVLELCMGVCVFSPNITCLNYQALPVVVGFPIYPHLTYGNWTVASFKSTSLKNFKALKIICKVFVRCKIRYPTTY